MNITYSSKTTIILITIIHTLIAQSVYSKTITIPKDADSIQEAVELAVSGDEIVVATDSVDWTRLSYSREYMRSDSQGVKVIDKDLVIIGKPVEGKTTIRSAYPNGHDNTNTMLLVKNSNVTIQNCYIQTPLKSRYVSAIYGGLVASPLYIESGQLKIIDCSFNCLIECKGSLVINTSTIHGYSYLYGGGYTSYNILYPAILFGHSNNESLVIQNSTISANIHDSYNNIIIDNALDSTLICKQSRFIGGTYDVGYGSYPDSNIHGSHSFSIDNCRNLRMSIDDCIFQGGKGYDARSHRHLIKQGGGDGGAGLVISNSNGEIVFDGSPSTFIGGIGGNGLANQDPVITRIPVAIDGGRWRRGNRSTQFFHASYIQNLQEPFHAKAD